jgi:predicted nucleic acid-binding protein
VARSDSLWLDSDVILDWLANREPWDAAATEIIERAILGEWALCFSPLTLANVHYIYRKHSGNAESLNAIATLAKIGSIATMDSSHVRRALASGHSDFEDALQIASASTVAGLTAIITRNLTDYSHAPVLAMTAQDWLLQHPNHPNQSPSD